MAGQRISVIIPCRNASGTISRQLDAVAGQLPADGEIIVIDDASTDATADTVRGWGDEHRSTKLSVVTRPQRGGPNASRNDGLRRSAGSTLLFCDGDDVVADGWLDALAGAVVTDVIAGGVYVPFSEEESIGSGASPTAEWSGVAIAHGWPYAQGGCLGVKRETLLALGGFDEAITSGGTEVELAIRAQVRSATTVLNVPEAVVYYRIPPPGSPREWFEREFRKERGRAYLRAKFGGAIVSDRSLRHLAGLWRQVPREARHSDTRWKAARSLGKALGWMFWAPVATLAVRLGVPSFREHLVADAPID